MWLLTFPVFAYLLVGAHFLRSGDMVLVGAALVLMGLLAVRRAWAAHMARLALFLSALVWLRALVGMAAMRYSMELPFLRLTLILGAVMVLTVGSMFVFLHPAVRRFYRLPGAA